MPQIKSAKKRVRQTENRTARNRGRKERFKKTVREFRKVIASPEKAAEAAGSSVATLAAQQLAKITKAIDKAGDKHIIHRNAVNRRKSRAAIAINKALKASTSGS